MRLHRYVRVLVATALIAFAITLVSNEQDALAQSCTTTGYTYNASCSGNGNSAGATVVGSATTALAAQAALGLVQSRVHAVRPGSSVMGEGISTKNLIAAGNTSGVNAGEAMDTRLGLWANGSYLTSKGSKTSAKFDSDLRAGAVGVDYRFGEATIAGISAGYEKNDVNTSFNNGKLTDDGWTVSPYVSFGLNKYFSIDGLFGYSQLSYDSIRPDPLAGGGIKGNFDSTRYMGDLEAVANWELYQWRLGARGGASYIKEDQDAYTESNGTARASQDITIGTALIGGSLGYVFQMGSMSTIEPYITARYGYDFDKAGGAYDNPNTISGTAGVALGMGPNVQLSVEGIASEKTDLKSYGGTANLRLNF